MILSVVTLLLVGIVAYFHYAQGLFSALISAVITIVAVLMAISYHETLVNSLFKTKMPDESYAFAMALIFMVVYVALRFLFDSTVPGNVRLPATLDKVGAAIFGLIAGLFVTGLFAIAIQTMPFGPNVMGFSRFRLAEERPVQMPARGQALDETVSDELYSDKFTDSDRQSLWVPVDDLVINFAQQQSETGALAGDQPLTAIHPNYLDEAFGDRIGIEPSARHTILNIPGAEEVSVSAAYLIDSIPQGDAEIPQIRSLKLSPVLKSDPVNTIIAFRVMFSSRGSDADKNVRFSPGSIRLVANGKDYWPVGTIDNSGVLRADKPDDYLVVNCSGGETPVDIVFQVPTADVLNGAPPPKSSEKSSKTEAPAVTFKDGTFLEIKRLARFSLPDIKIVPPLSQTKDSGVMQKPKVPAVAGAAMAVSDASSVPFSVESTSASPTLFTEIAVGGYAGDDADVSFSSGTGHVTGGKFTRFNVTATDPLSKLREGDHPTSTLWAPPGMTVVQVTGAPPPTASNPWEWAQKINSFELVDANGQHYKPTGAWAKAIKATQPVMVGNYNAQGTAAPITPQADARPINVYMSFSVPSHSTLKEFDYQGHRVQSLDYAVP